MGGVSASSARGIRTSTAGAVCLDLNSQLLLLHRSPQTLPDNPRLWCEGEDSRVKQLHWVSGRRMGPELFLLLLLFKVGWGQEQRGGGGRGLSSSSSSSRDGVSADKEPDVWQTVLCEMMDWLTPFQASQGSGCSVPTWLHEKQHNTWLSASGFPQTKTTPCWQSRHKLRAHILTLRLWSVVYYELRVYKPKYN